MNIFGSCYLLKALPSVGEDGLEDDTVLIDEAAVLVVLLGVLTLLHEVLNQTRKVKSLHYSRKKIRLSRVYIYIDNKN